MTKLHKTILLALLLTLFLTGNVRAERHCDATNYLLGPSDADRVLWEHLTERGFNLWELRNWISEYYDLSEGDWDGGWGYHKWDEEDPYYWEYPRMMSAGIFLWFGLNENITLPVSWSTTGISAFPESQPAIVSRNHSSIDLVSFDSNGRFIHSVLSSGTGVWQAGAEPPVNTTNRFWLTAKDGKVIRLDGNPAMISKNANTLDVFARSEKELHYLTWNAATNWSTDNTSLTTIMTRPVQSNDPECRDRYCIHTDPIPHVRGDNIEVFALDKLDHLIRYYHPSGYGWHAEDVTDLTNAVSQHGEFRFTGNPIVISPDNSTVMVFLKNQYGHLILFQKSGDNPWQFENLTKTYGESYTLASDPSVVLQGSEVIHIFARSTSDRLIDYTRSSVSPWRVDDLTASLNSEPVEGSPAAIVDGAGGVHVFTQASGVHVGHLYHYNLLPGAIWAVNDLTTTCPSNEQCSDSFRNHRIASDPVVTIKDKRIDLFARNLANNLVHYFWTRKFGWLAENASNSPTLSPYYGNVTDQPLKVIERSADALDVISNRGRRIYSSALGESIVSLHTNEEYSRWASGNVHEFEYQPAEAGDNEDVGGEAFWGWFSDDHVNIYCTGFSTAVAQRAGIMVHEATHMNFHIEHDYNDVFPENSAENCDDIECWDNWIDTHWVREPGTLSQAVPGNVINRTHTPYQMEIEYLCDVSEFMGRNLPIEINRGADTIANAIMDEHVLVKPDWSCGLPRPLY